MFKIAIALSAMLFAGGALAETLTGRASVIDGDTIEIHGQRIRLFGRDAPEGGQTCLSAAGKAWRCGTAAAREVDALTRGKTVSCEMRDIDRYGRIVAICSAGGHDIARVLVEQGLAVAYRRYSHDYIASEDKARSAGSGMWGGTFQMPYEWRKNH